MPPQVDIAAAAAAIKHPGSYACSFTSPCSLTCPCSLMCPRAILWLLPAGLAPNPAKLQNPPLTPPFTNCHCNPTTKETMPLQRQDGAQREDNDHEYRGGNQEGRVAPRRRRCHEDLEQSCCPCSQHGHARTCRRCSPPSNGVPLRVCYRGPPRTIFEDEHDQQDSCQHTRHVV